MKQPVGDIAWMLDALPYAIFAKDSQHRWVYGNKAFSQLLGREEFVGYDDRAVFDQAQVEEFWREDDKVFAGEESLNEEQIGENTFALTKKVPLYFPDGTTGLLGIIIDSIQVGASGQADCGLMPSLLEYADRRSTELQHRLSDALKAKEVALKIAETDAATGLRNRFGYEVDIAQHIEQYASDAKPFSVA
ncbi:MAG: PAS domain-containing protein, partial [Henriciella sp.]|uniref:PAS domain-containing protein n=1 Tax=Henriciella sp. TaxID=1968823 RepID=UPI003C771A59